MVWFSVGGSDVEEDDGDDEVNDVDTTPPPGIRAPSR
jgi:hypothetical protein